MSYTHWTAIPADCVFNTHPTASACMPRCAVWHPDLHRSLFLPRFGCSHPRSAAPCGGAKQERRQRQCSLKRKDSSHLDKDRLGGAAEAVDREVGPCRTFLVLPFHLPAALIWLSYLLVLRLQAATVCGLHSPTSPVDGATWSIRAAHSLPSPRATSYTAGAASDGSGSPAMAIAAPGDSLLLALPGDTRPCINTDSSAPPPLPHFCDHLQPAVWQLSG